MQATRILRYVGNREIPEKELYSPLERMIQFSGMRSQADFALTGDYTVFRNIPNPLFSDFKKEEDCQIYVPSNPDVLAGAFLSSMFSFRASRPRKKNPQKPAEVDFEVNMMEALTGWKSWNFDGESLTSHVAHCIWKADTPAEAKCHNGCTKVPAEHHCCGIYGTDSRDTANEYGEILGLVYGWGRYIRHEGGWKAQYAYPKCFYLRLEQMDLVDRLKQYHVPIYVSQPMRMYDPEEDGYEYRGEEENGNRGAAEIPASGEERDTSEDYED